MANSQILLSVVLFFTFCFSNVLMYFLAHFLLFFLNLCPLQLLSKVSFYYFRSAHPVEILFPLFHLLLQPINRINHSGSITTSPNTFAKSANLIKAFAIFCGARMPTRHICYLPSYPGVILRDKQTEYFPDSALISIKIRHMSPQLIWGSTGGGSDQARVFR
jgi:hypothetical protein